MLEVEGREGVMFQEQPPAVSRRWQLVAVVSKLSSFSSAPVPAGSGVPGGQRQACHGHTVSGGESGAVRSPGEEDTGPVVCRALGPEHRQGPPGSRTMGQMPGRRQTPCATYAHLMPLAFLKGSLILKEGEGGI